MPRDRPHIYLERSGRSERYVSRQKSRPHRLPQRERSAHADLLLTAVARALAGVELTREERDLQLLSGNPGFYLEFEIPPGAEVAAESLENRPKGIELVTFRQESENGPALATVFVPDSAADHFSTKIEEYRNQTTRPRQSTGPDPRPIPGRPKNERLIASIENIRLAAVRSLYTDDPALFPTSDQSMWWEVWVRRDYVDAFESVATGLGIPREERHLVFPEREVRLLYADIQMLGRLFLNSNAIAEIRLAKDTPALFVSWSNVEQADWATDLAARVVVPDSRSVAVCLLDTGVTQAHPLIAPGLDTADLHKYDPTWADGDQHGHGTNMAGTLLYGDLIPWLEADTSVPLTHCLESVKILPDHDQNPPRLYGAITGESIARAEVEAPDRCRAVCMAVTSDGGTNRGRPSSWSAAIDQLSFGDDLTRRLILLSAGNIRHGLRPQDYLARNEIESIENPAQAWNAITVGAFTEKANLTDPTLDGWEPIAPVGDLCPTSRTSMIWERQWPIKPDILMEGGNWATNGDICDCPDDLGLLTTYRDPTTRHFDVVRDTSAATALAGHLAGRILAAMPQRWPETVRALMVHSAEWTPVMRQMFDAAATQREKLTLLRKYGYGVPSYERAVLSATNDLTIVAEDELQPLWKDRSSIRTRDMNLHSFPWPRAQLEELGEMQVELRITLSYFIEPNPGERGWLRRHRYASHALRFAVKRALESVDEFRGRINAAAAEEERGAAPSVGSDNWYLGRIRNLGSIHSDYWTGSAVELSQRSAVAVYPVGGWWKENPRHQRFDRSVRYALIVSILAPGSAADIYTPVQAQIAVPTEVTI